MALKQRWDEVQVNLAKQLLAIRAPDEDFRRLLKRTKMACRIHINRIMSVEERNKIDQEKNGSRKCKGKHSRLGIVAALKLQSDEYKRPSPSAKELEWVGWEPTTPNEYWLGDPPFKRSALYASMTGEC